MKTLHFPTSKLARAAMAVTLAFTLFSQTDKARAANIVETAVGAGSFKTLVAAVQAADLVTTLQSPGPFTVFAPTDAAFAKLPPGTVESLVANPAKLRQILLYHVVPGRVRSTDLVAGKVVTAQGAAATIALSGGPKIDNANITATDVEASNGIIHVIDSVILPPGDIVEIAISNPAFSTLIAAVQAASLVDTLKGSGPFTVFAPTDAAFAKLPPGTVESLVANPAKLRQILLYHVVPGRVRSTDLVAGKVVTAQGAAATIALSGGPKIDNANIIATDVEASNGIIHVIDSVILPPPTLGEIAGSNPAFSTLAAAVEAAGLSKLVLADRATTVFAPNNDAFAKLPPGTVTQLLADTNKLKTILLYHMVKGRTRAADLRPGHLVTLQGAAVSVDTSSGVKINDSKVILADVEASNGIIHAIDTVLLPPPNIVELAAGNPQFSTLVAAVQAAGLVETLTAHGPYTVFAPNNDAFAKLPPGTLEALIANPARLKHILLYHINHGPRLRSTDLVDGNILTLQGAPAGIDVSESGVKINQASVIAANIEALNGVIHVIDQVILPGDGFTGIQVSTVVKGGKATVVWPLVLGTPFKLESSSKIDGPWTAVTSDVITADGIQKTEIPATAPQAFFRVRSEPTPSGE